MFLKLDLINLSNIERLEIVKMCKENNFIPLLVLICSFNYII